MIKDLIKYSIWFVVLVAFQLLVLNNIQFSGYVNPYMYILLILILPYSTPNWALLVIGFLLGLSIDIGNNTLGINASATVFIAFLRPIVLELISSRDGYEKEKQLHFSNYGIKWYLQYSLILIFAHHFFLFFIEVFTFGDFFYTIWRVLLSFIFTSIIIFISQLFFIRK